MIAVQVAEIILKIKEKKIGRHRISAVATVKQAILSRTRAYFLLHKSSSNICRGFEDRNKAFAAMVQNLTKL